MLSSLRFEYYSRQFPIRDKNEYPNLMATTFLKDLFWGEFKAYSS